MNAAGTWLELFISCGIVAMALCIGEIVREHPDPLPAPPPAIRLTAADFLAAPVHEDTATILLPECLEINDPQEFWRRALWQDLADKAAARGAENAAKVAASARESARRIGEAIRSRQAVAAQSALIAAIRASYAELTLEGTWDDLVAAIRDVMGSAA